MDYLVLQLEDEEDAENEEIKMYNEQDDSLGGPMAKRISKSSEQVERMEDTNRKMYNEFEEPGRIHIHKLPLKIGEDSNRIGVRLPAQPPRNALGLQTILPQLSPPFMGSGPMSVSPPALTDNQNGIDLRPNVVMPLDQSFMLPGAGQVSQMTGNTQMETPNMAAFSNSNYQPGVTNEVNNMIPQTAFSQASSMFPMQTDSTGTPMNPNMLPGQAKSVISGSKNRTRKPAVKKTDSHQKRLIIQRGEKITA